MPAADLKTSAWRELRRIVLATEDTCGICHRPVDKDIRYPHPMSAAVDHIVPRAKGGDLYARDNAQLVHLRCNSAKRDGRVARPRPSRRWHG